MHYSELQNFWFDMKVDRGGVTDLGIANSVDWDPFDNAAKAEQENLLTNTYDAALRKLAPDMGAYMNEVCICSRLNSQFLSTLLSFVSFLTLC